MSLVGQHLLFVCSRCAYGVAEIGGSMSIGSFVIGVAFGIAIGVLAAVFWPERWAKVVRESGEELKPGPE